ncbi:MAG TPA: CYCXC family (seleno)protein [Candidatus Binataceae bacterium]|nr:CYCXC family (seleno)protein [Candidatus Binataceae bacterium]
MVVGGVVIALLTLVSATIYRVRLAPSAAAEQALTLDPKQFEGDTRMAYEVAKAHPDLLAQLDCYCGCEQHEGHKNLLDCFRTNHGAGCDTCVGEAVAAGKLADGGMPVDQIRQALHDRYAHGS